MTTTVLYIMLTFVMSCLNYLFKCLIFYLSLPLFCRWKGLYLFIWPVVSLINIELGVNPPQHHLAPGANTVILSVTVHPHSLCFCPPHPFYLCPPSFLLSLSTIILSVTVYPHSPYFLSAPHPFYLCPPSFLLSLPPIILSVSVYP